MLRVLVVVDEARAKPKQKHLMQYKTVLVVHIQVRLSGFPILHRTAIDATQNILILVWCAYARFFDSQLRVTSLWNQMKLLGTLCVAILCFYLCT